MADDFDELVGGNVKNCRMAVGMSQAALADAISKPGEQMAQQTILKIEQGNRPLKFSEAMRIAEVLKVKVDALTKVSGQAAADAYLTSLMDSVKLLHNDLRDFAGKLAKPLADLAHAVGANRGTHEQRRASSLRIAAAGHLLGTRWGDDLESALLAAITEYADLADTKPGTVAEALQQLEAVLGGGGDDGAEA